MTMFDKDAEDTSKNKSDDSDDADDSEDNDDSEDSSQDDDDADDTDTESNDEEDSEDITRQYFTDPDSLDPKLRGAFKRMQGIFTRKMQEAGFHVEKSQAFDKLVLDPEFREWMEERKGNVTKGASKKSNSDDDDDDDTPVTKKDLMAFLNNVNRQSDLEKQQEIYKQEAAQFKKDNPDWEMYTDELRKVMTAHPTLDYQTAYDLVTAKATKHTSKKDMIAAKKKANINKPNRTGAKDAEDDKAKKLDMHSAYLKAKRTLGIK
jgi:hypothetical protein